MRVNSAHASAVLRIVSSAAFGCLVGCGGGSDIGGDPPPPGYAYITSASEATTQSGVVYQYAVASDGFFAPLGTASAPAGLSPGAIVSDPTGHYAYVVNQGDVTISQYVVGSGGGLIPLSPATVSVGEPFPDTRHLVSQRFNESTVDTNTTSGWRVILGYVKRINIPWASGARTHRTAF
jgi:hypothetical protein